MVTIKEMNGNEIDSIMSAIKHGKTSIKAITEHIGNLPRSNVRYYITKLEQIGFANVAYDKDGTIVTLTEAGNKYYNKPVDIIILKH